MRAATLIAVVSMLLITGPMVAQDSSDFDLDHDGQLNLGELSALILHRNNPAFEDLDEDKNGQISPEERNKRVELILAEIQDACGGPPYKIVDIDNCFPPEPEGLSLGGLLIRRTHEAVDLANPAKSKDKAEPALLSYGHNRIDNSSQWQLQGSILRPFNIFSAEDADRRLSAVLLVPSLTFDRLETTKKDDEDDELDSLVLRASVDLELHNGFFDLENYRTSLSFATDFSREVDVRGVEFDWEPQYLRSGLGVFQPIGTTPFSYRLRFIAHAEAGKVYDAGDNENLVEGSDFLRVGPKVTIEVQPSFFKLLKLSLNWEYRYGINGKPEQSELTTAAVNLSLDQSESISLELVFQNGQLPLTLEEAESVQVGVGLKF